MSMAYRRRGESLRRGADCKQRLLVDRCLVAEFANAIAFCKDDLVVLDDGHCNPWDLPLLERFVDVFVELFARALPAPETDCETQTTIASTAIIQTGIFLLIESLLCSVSDLCHLCNLFNPSFSHSLRIAA